MNLLNSGGSSKQKRGPLFHLMRVIQSLIRAVRAGMKSDHNRRAAISL